MPRSSFIAALVTAAALIVPAAASAQAPTSNQGLAGVQQQASALQTQIKIVNDRMKSRANAIADMQRQIAAANATHNPFVVAAVIATFAPQINALNAANQQDMQLLQSLMKQYEDLQALVTNAMKKLSDSTAALVGNIRP